MSDKSYNPQALEHKWQAKWDETGLYRSKVDWDKPKHYALTMLPYPSGNLHIGHWFAMTPSDARARYMRMQGYNVLFPMGFDAFGLPAENAAVTRNIHPAKWTYSNIDNMRQQMRSMGAMFDWEREAVSCEPGYYQWTEWFFKQFYENDLAFRGEALVNWSPTLQTVLANEQVIDGKDERTGQPVIQKMMEQWFFRYTAYADEMLSFDTLDWPEPVKIMQTNWIGRSEGANVIFKTEAGDDLEIYTTRPDTLWGATFMVLAPEHKLVEKLTTDEQRAEVDAYVEAAANATEIERTAEGRDKTGVFTGSYAINPVNEAKVPIWIADYVMVTYGTGAIMAVPFGDQRDFEFARKFELKIVPVVQPPDMDETITADTMQEAYAGPGTMINSGPIDGVENNGAKGRKNPAIAKTLDWLEERGVGRESVNYRLRDWLVSRQRYWGCPIPIVYKEDGTMASVDDANLPVELPEDVDFMPSGRSPLTYHEPFLNTTDANGKPARRETDTMDTFLCSSWYHLRYLSPKYDDGPFDPEEAAYWLPVDVYTGGAEHATMHLLYTRWFNKALRDLGIFDEAKRIAAKHGREIDGIFDEPMLLLRNQGQILGEERPGDTLHVSGKREGGRLMASTVTVVANGNIPDASGEVFMGELMRRTENILHVKNPAGEEVIVEVPEGATIDIPSIAGENDVNQLKHHLEIQRMSKSKGNVVDPDTLVAQYGADTVRAYLMQGFDWIKGGPWDTTQISGPERWLRDVWNIVAEGAPEGDGTENTNRALERAVHKAIKQVSDSMASFSFNTAVSGLMGLRSEFKKLMATGEVGKAAWDEAVRNMLLMMAPISPHIAEELWEQVGGEYSVHQQSWPVYDAEKAKDDTVQLVIMVKGKPRGHIDVPADIAEEDAKRLALESEEAQRFMNGGQPKKVIFIPGRPGNPEPKVNIVI